MICWHKRHITSDEKSGVVQVNNGLTDVDPLIIFRCKNKQCRQMFTPQALMNENTKKITFECPVCGSKYEAHYSDVEYNPSQKAIMLLEWPRLTFLGTRIASS